MEYCNNKQENSKKKPHLNRVLFLQWWRFSAVPGPPHRLQTLTPADTATDVHIHVTSDATPRCELNQGHSRQPALAPGLLPLHLAVPTWCRDTGGAMLTQGHLTSHSGTSDCSICEEQDTEIISQTRQNLRMWTLPESGDTGGAERMVEDLYGHHDVGALFPRFTIVSSHANNGEPQQGGGVLPEPRQPGPAPLLHHWCPGLPWKRRRSSLPLQRELACHGRVSHCPLLHCYVFLHISWKYNSLDWSSSLISLLSHPQPLYSSLARSTGPLPPSLSNTCVVV